MSTCDTCKWWNTEGGDAKSHRSCANEKVQEDSETRKKMGLSLDGSVYTAAKFGCDLHEPK